MSKSRINVMSVLLVAVIFSFSACGSSSSTPTPTPGGRTVSTDATVNENLITSFTGTNSVSVVGTWTNNTFGSTGDVAAQVSFDPVTKIATIVFDIDGSVYGGGDPAAETFTVDMSEFIANGTATLTATSTTYGDISVTLTFYDDNTGTFTGTAENEPSGQVTNASFSGTFEISGSTVSFTIADSSFDFGGQTVTCSTNVTSTLN